MLLLESAVFVDNDGGFSHFLSNAVFAGFAKEVTLCSRA